MRAPIILRDNLTRLFTVFSHGEVTEGVQFRDGAVAVSSGGGMIACYENLEALLAHCRGRVSIAWRSPGD